MAWPPLFAGASHTFCRPPSCTPAPPAPSGPTPTRLRSVARRLGTSGILLVAPCGHEEGGRGRRGSRPRRLAPHGNAVPCGTETGFPLRCVVWSGSPSGTAEGKAALDQGDGLDTVGSERKINSGHSGPRPDVGMVATRFGRAAGTDKIGDVMSLRRMTCRTWWVGVAGYTYIQVAGAQWPVGAGGGHTTSHLHISYNLVAVALDPVAVCRQWWQILANMARVHDSAQNDTTRDPFHPQNASGTGG